eukprot:TRINITY_DN1538_c0_g1_i3.p1 TRINITY_DN1538_c0_g1~~TRINITY_DN1538_c0_g1_i3.p1  ORF type:complete len:462 (+),score=70.94 TRINITY_DN1538_c0_g1_i3:87-1472(+)
MECLSSASGLWDISPEDFATRFRLGDRLGQGQLGVVHVCHDKATGEIVGACKSIGKEKLKSRALYNVVVAEIAAMQSVSGHKNVLELKGVFEDDLAVHLIIDICMGGDLFKHISTVERLEEGAAARLVQQVLLGLQHCHERGVLHRDVKPENILITHFAPSGPQGRAEPQIKLADFGFAALVNAGDSTSGFFGSPLYMAPEVIQRVPYGSSADVWSAGVILYTSLCGFMPFYGSDSEVFSQVLRGDSNIDFHSHPWDMISSMAKDLVRSMLCLDPSSRISVEDALNHPWMEFHCLSHAVCRKDSLKDRLRRLRALGSSRSSRGQAASQHEQVGRPRGTESDAAACAMHSEAESTAVTPSGASSGSSPFHSKLFHNSPRSPFDAFFSSPRAPSVAGTTVNCRTSLDSLTRTNNSSRVNSLVAGPFDVACNVSPSASPLSPSRSKREGFNYLQKFKTTSFGRH